MPKASRNARAVELAEERLRAKAEKESNKLIKEATKFYDETVKDYAEAMGGGREVQAKCQERYARLVADLSAQDAIIADSYKAILELSADMEHNVRSTVDAIGAEMNRGVQAARNAQGGIEGAQGLEKAPLDSLGLNVSVRL